MGRGGTRIWFSSDSNLKSPLSASGHQQTDTHMQTRQSKGFSLSPLFCSVRQPESLSHSKLSFASASSILHACHFTFVLVNRKNNSHPHLRKQRTCSFKLKRIYSAPLISESWIQLRLQIVADSCFSCDWVDYLFSTFLLTFLFALTCSLFLGHDSSSSLHRPSLIFPSFLSPSPLYSIKSMSCQSFQNGLSIVFHGPFSFSLLAYLPIAAGTCNLLCLSCDCSLFCSSSIIQIAYFCSFPSFHADYHH